ncbi:MAG: Gfo/Idh/MocA family oxidoreductase [Candidatus Sumerlaeota bacterium]|nr:Gfo/Idh/MocA family oxidoreductase [Candidatus Sumerlaeota bacterium]
MDEIRMGMIGTGGIARGVHLPGIAAVGGARVVWAADADTARVASFARDFGIEKTATDYREMLADPGVQAVVSATPNNTHFEIASAALAAGKHVMLEKPVSMDHASARRLWEQAKAGGLVNMVAFTYRWHPGIAFLADLAKRGVFGKRRMFRAHYLGGFVTAESNFSWRMLKDVAGSGVIGDLGSHAIDWARFLCPEIAAVCGSVRTVIERHRDPRTGEARKVENDDAALLLLRFEDDSQGFIEVSRAATGHSEDQFIEITGNDGAARYDFRDLDTLEVCQGAVGLESKEFARIPIPQRLRYINGMYRRLPLGDPYVTFRFEQARAFIHAIRSGRPAKPDFYDGYRAQLVHDLALESANDGAWKTVPKE